MKKFLAILLSLVMVLTLVACGEKPVDNPDDSTEDPGVQVPEGRTEILV